MSFTRSTRTLTSKPGGIALITVLIVVTLLSLLLLSFTRVHQQSFGLIKNDLHDQAAQAGARSVFGYCLFRLENDRSWGAGKFDGEPDPGLPEGLDIEEEAGTRKLGGRVVQTDTEFEVEVLNNIDGSAMVDGVPKGFCRLRIQANRGTATVRREALLSTAPLFDAGVLASRNIYVDAEKFKVASTDPFRNRLRAKGRINIPSFRGNFQFHPADNATEKGVLWAKAGILSGGDKLSDSEVAAEAARITGGRFLPHADTFHDIYDLQLSEVVASSETTEISSGVYVFNRRFIEVRVGDSTEVREIPVLERRESALDEDGRLLPGDIEEVWFLKNNLPEEAAARSVDFFVDVPPDKVHAKSKNQFLLDTGVEVKFNSVDPLFGGDRPPEFLVNTKRNLTIDGDFGLTSVNPKFYPTVKFWDRRTGEVGTDKDGNLISGSITTKATDGEHGSIHIAGRILGNGKLLAEGDVTVRNTFANVSSDKLSDLSIYAGGTVALRPQKARKFDDRVFFDGKVAGATNFRGLIFARDDVIIEADLDPREDRQERGNVSIEGAVVSRSGSVRVHLADRIEFKYNPDYLDSILRPKKEARVRLEQVVWKEL